MEARPDPPVGRYRPDVELLAHAHNRLLAREDPPERFVRQCWEHALGAVKVAVDELREIYPSETYFLGRSERIEVEDALRSLEKAWTCLNAIEETMLGTPMQAVLHGGVTTVEDYEQLFEPSPPDSPEEQ